VAQSRAVGYTPRHGALAGRYRRGRARRFSRSPRAGRHQSGAHFESAVRLTFERRDGNAPATEITVDPYTTQVLGQRGAEDHLIAIIYSLHYRLLLDQGTGMTLNGILGLAMILSSITGLKLWWPPQASVKSALTIKCSASFKRINFDLHRTGGFWSFAVALIVAFTGAVMCFYDSAAPSGSTKNFWRRPKERIQ
jgi:uncharacterized iron-regulated membrane protein